MWYYTGIDYPRRRRPLYERLLVPYGDKLLRLRSMKALSEFYRRHEISR
jgi:hypothetical protein